MKELDVLDLPFLTKICRVCLYGELEDNFVNECEECIVKIVRDKLRSEKFGEAKG